MRAAIRRPVAALLAAALLAGCSTRASRIGGDDGLDACRPQLVALDSTGDFFGEDILRGAAIGAASGGLLGALVGAAAGGRGRDIAIGAGIGILAGGAVGAAGGYLAARQRQAQDQASLAGAIGGDLAAENAQIDRTQLAFNQLVDCRLLAAEAIRRDVSGGRLAPAQGQSMMAELRGRMQRDIELAKQINQKIATRGAEFDTAIDSVAPGTREQVAARAPAPAQATPRQPVPLRIRPEPAAPEVGRIAANERVTIRPAADNYALVETPSGVRGYAPLAALGSRRPPTTSLPPANGGGGEVRELAASNIARRDNFSESVTNAERVTQGQGFELAG